MNCTPKIRQKKINFWGVVFMKLSCGEEAKIYELRPMVLAYFFIFSLILAQNDNKLACIVMARNGNLLYNRLIK